MFDLPCEYGKKALCMHPDVIDEIGRGKKVPTTLCLFGRCDDWVPNQIQLLTLGLLCNAEESESSS